MSLTTRKNAGIVLNRSKRIQRRSCLNISKAGDRRWISAGTIAIVALCGSGIAVSETGNCLLCHKMKGLSIYIDEEIGERRKREFYIDENKYQQSYHGHLGCVDCHKDIGQIPHGEVEKVDCASDCHIKDPSSNHWYSHKNVEKDLRASAHGMKKKDFKDFPDCKYCHTNKPYQSDAQENRHLKEFISICLQCHESADWTERFYRHINYRVKVRRSSKEVVALCIECHGDGEMMGRHGLDVVVGFNDTFHGKAIKYGNTEVANCLNCHAPYQDGYSPHNILSRTDHRSPVFPENKLHTCRQAGCHTEAKEAFASNGKVHPSSYGMVSWLRPRIDDTGGEEKDVFQKRVIYLIKLFYKIMIVVVVGGLAFHQLLNLRTLRKEAREGERI